MVCFAVSSKNDVSIKRLCELEKLKSPADRAAIPAFAALTAIKCMMAETRQV